jgi:hypothetical protein
VVRISWRENGGAGTTLLVSESGVRLMGEMECWRVETERPEINAHDFFPHY